MLFVARFYSFAHGESPALLWLCLVVPGLDDPGLISNLELIEVVLSLPSLGRLTPPYIGGRGRLTCRVLVGYKLVSSSITSRISIRVLL